MHPDRTAKKEDSAYMIVTSHRMAAYMRLTHVRICGELVRETGGHVYIQMKEYVGRQF